MLSIFLISLILVSICFLAAHGKQGLRIQETEIVDVGGGKISELEEKQAESELTEALEAPDAFELPEAPIHKVIQKKVIEKIGEKYNVPPIVTDKISEKLANDNIDIIPYLIEQKQCPCSGLTYLLPATVKVDGPAFIGRWFQVYNSFGSAKTFMKNRNQCVTEDLYEYSTNDTIIRDSYYLVAGSFDIESQASSIATGYIYPQCPCSDRGDGKFYLQMTTFEKPAWYWVYKLGPIVNGVYQYKVITTPLGALLFIHARDPATFKEQYEADLLEELKRDGFCTPFNSPLPSYQGSDCEYVNPNTIPPF